MCSNSENEMKMRTRSSNSSSSSPRCVTSKKRKEKSVTNEHQQSSKLKPLAKKARKHKFLSDLRRELSRNDTRDDRRMSNNDDDDDDDQLLIKLFPLHPKRSLGKESHKHDHSTKDLQHEEDHSNTIVTYNFFDNTTDCGAASLTGVLWDSIGGADKQCSTKKEESLSPQSLTYSFQGEGSDGLDGNSLLLRTALRQKEREMDCSTTEEKWVFYSEVVAKKEEEEDTNPITYTPDSGNHYQQHQISPRLSLKLDYEVIMNAWSDKGSLYIGGDCTSSQIVPDILDDLLTPDTSTNNVMYGDAAGSMLWKVPEQHHLRHDGAQSIDGRREYHSKMMEDREARVLRYKEKRQNLLFTKRIRYEVRKLNAEKRPRLKGRFVKRS